MKVCNKCGDEISGGDGINTCKKCKIKSAEKRKQNRRAIDDVMKSLGLVKVRGAMGGTYYE